MQKKNTFFFIIFERKYLRRRTKGRISEKMQRKHRRHGNIAWRLIDNSQFIILCKQSCARKHERYFKQQKTRKTRKNLFLNTDSTDLHGKGYHKQPPAWSSPARARTDLHGKGYHKQQKTLKSRKNLFLNTDSADLHGKGYHKQQKTRKTRKHSLTANWQLTIHNSQFIILCKQSAARLHNS